MREPDDDRDEPTDDEIADHIATHTDCEAEIVDMMWLTTDREILQWAHNLRQSIYEAIIEARNDRSDGDE
jgi:hypothetical protein